MDRRASLDLGELGGVREAPDWPEGVGRDRRERLPRATEVRQREGRTPPVAPGDRLVGPERGDFGHVPADPETDPTQGECGPSCGSLVGEQFAEGIDRRNDLESVRRCRRFVVRRRFASAPRPRTEDGVGGSGRPELERVRGTATHALVVVVDQRRDLEGDRRVPCDEPLAFRSDRWMDEFEEHLPDFAYAPFGGGRRTCIGREFALLEAKVVLATIGQQYRFDWERTGDLDLSPRCRRRPPRSSGTP